MKFSQGNMIIYQQNMAEFFNVNESFFIPIHLQSPYLNLGQDQYSTI